MIFCLLCKLSLILMCEKLLELLQVTLTCFHAHVSGWHSVHRVCMDAQVEFPKRLTATKMRHRVSTLYAALDVSQNERELFFKHMGHSANINQIVYQVPLAEAEILTVGARLQATDGQRLDSQSVSASSDAHKSVNVDTNSGEESGKGAHLQDVDSSGETGILLDFMVYTGGTWTEISSQILSCWHRTNSSDTHPTISQQTWTKATVYSSIISIHLQNSLYTCSRSRRHWWGLSELLGTTFPPSLPARTFSGVRQSFLCLIVTCWQSSTERSRIRPTRSRKSFTYWLPHTVMTLPPPIRTRTAM